MQNVFMRSSFIAISSTAVFAAQINKKSLVIHNDVEIIPEHKENEVILAKFGIKASNVERIDPIGNEKVKRIFNASSNGKHLLRHTLAIPGGIEKYAIYKYKQTSQSTSKSIKNEDDNNSNNNSNNQDEIIALIRFGDAVCGHPSIVHGGMISTMIDDAYGWVFIAGRRQVGFTANLNVNFRRPIRSDDVVILKSKIVEEKGRKFKLISTVSNLKGDVMVDSTAIFLQPKLETVKGLWMYFHHVKTQLWLYWLEKTTF